MEGVRSRNGGLDDTSREDENAPSPQGPSHRSGSSDVAELAPITGDGKFLFPSIRSVERPITDNTLNAALRRLGFGKEEVSAHGFRATASTLLNEMGKWHPDAIERQLAHVESSDVRRAYARGTHWDERVKMMRHWSNYLDSLQIGGTILKANFRRK